MKKIYKITFSVLALMVITSTGCKKIIDEDVNVNPNNPIDAPMSLLLPSAEGGLAFSLGSDLGRFPSLFVQSLSGLSNQHLLYDNYSLTESDVNNMWYYNLYGGVMTNLKIIMDKAAATNSPYYGGIAKILMANTLGVTTDLWGDIPYSQAFKGVDGLTPKYDTQEQIYEAIQALLSSAVSDLSASSSTFVPGGDDLIYGGDLAAWTQTANALSARYWLHLGKRFGSTAYTNALTSLSNGSYTDNSTNALFVFGVDPTTANPWYQFFYDARPGDAGMGKVLVDQLLTTNDPRLPLIAAETGDSLIIYAGSAPGAGDVIVSNIGSFYGSSNSPVALITYPEIKFIEAEAQFQTGNLAGAATAFNDAVAASLDYFGVSDSTFSANYGNETGTSITLEKIISQKYVAMFTLGYEQWSDWRRTGFPALSLAAQAQTSIIPRRLPYPNSERLYNSSSNAAAIANQGGATLTNKVWWDQ